LKVTKGEERLSLHTTLYCQLAMI